MYSLFSHLMMWVICLFVLLCLANKSASFECSDKAKHCETSLTINYAFTMNSPDVGTVYSKNRRLYKREHNTTTEIPIENIISADGWETPRQLIVANGTMPGPPIVIYQNQTITIMVHNKLIHEGVTIHWHGIDQLGWPYMDGVAFVTQCPIMPGQSFNYTFQPTFGGTYWYHSHVGNQRDMGLYGAFIVLRKSDPIPYSRQFTLQLQEYNHFYNPVELLKAKSLNNSEPQSVLLNGRGEYNGNMAPLEVLTVNTNEKYKFRIIGVGSKEAMLFSIPGLKLNVTETDGFEVDQVEVDQIIVYPAERYDFTIDFSFVSADVYNITVHILQSKTLYEFEKAIGFALLNVTNDNLVSKNSNKGEILRILNCPFKVYPNKRKTECIPVSELTAHRNISDIKFGVPSVKLTGKRTTHFLNFGFPNGKSSINGRKFVWPTVSAISQPRELDTSCSECSSEKTCTCIHSINLEHGSEVTMVLLNLGTGMAISHPIHMHGHTYEVIKMGFPTTQSDSNTIVPTADIKCSETRRNNESHCSEAKWVNTSWNVVENIPGVNLENPVRKDTTVVPYGGYTVIHIQATNPGVWFMHCHIDPHMINGMALMLNESFSVMQSDVNFSVPSGFPVCHSYLNTMSGNIQSIQSSSTEEENGISDLSIGLIVVVVLFALVFLTAAVIYIKRINCCQGVV